MILTDEELNSRLESPDNLINKLARLREEALAPREDNNLELPKAPTLDDIMKNSETKIALGLAHDKAINLIDRALDTLSAKIDDIKPEKLPSVITAASKMVTDIRRERSEANKNADNRNVHFHFYKPEQKQLTDYEVIEVG